MLCFPKKITSVVCDVCPYSQYLSFDRFDDLCAVTCFANQVFLINVCAFDHKKKRLCLSNMVEVLPTNLWFCRWYSDYEFAVCSSDRRMLLSGRRSYAGLIGSEICLRFARDGWSIDAPDPSVFAPQFFSGWSKSGSSCPLPGDWFKLPADIFTYLVEVEVGRMRLA